MYAMAMNLPTSSNKLQSLASAIAKAAAPKSEPCLGDRFTQSIPGPQGFGAFTGALPVAGAGIYALGGLTGNIASSLTAPVGVLAALFSGHYILEGLGLARSSYMASMLFIDGMSLLKCLA